MKGSNQAWACCLAVVCMFTALTEGTHPLKSKAPVKLPAPACFLLLNNAGGVGCAGTKGAETAPLFFIDGSDSLNNLLRDTKLSALAVLIPFSLFTPQAMEVCAASGKVKGVYVMQPGSAPEKGWSPFGPQATQCQGGQARAWAGPGSNDLGKKLLPFPVVQVNSTQSKELQDYAAQNAGNSVDDGSFPRWSLHMDYQMQADPAQSSMDCIEKKTCLPIGGYSPYAWFGQPLQQGTQTILLHSQLDAKAYFTDLAYGARASAASISVLLALAPKLQEVQSAIAHNGLSVVVAFTDADSYGRAGCRSLVNAITTGYACPQGKFEQRGQFCRNPFQTFPKQLEQLASSTVKQVVELGQLSPSSQLYVHTPCIPNVETSALGTTVKNAAGATLVSHGKPPPPSCLAEVWSAATNPPPTVLLSSSNESELPSNFSNSQFDSTFGDIDALCTHANKLSSVTSALTGVTVANPDCEVVKDIFGALMRDPSSKLYDQMYADGRKGTGYTSIFRAFVLQPRPWFVSQQLGEYTAASTSSNKDCTTDTDCHNGELCIKLKCRATSSSFAVAVSPAVNLDFDTNTVTVDRNIDVPTWAESYWKDGFGTEGYWQETAGMQAGFVILGILLTLASVLGGHFTQRHFERLFKSR